VGLDVIDIIKGERLRAAKLHADPKTTGDYSEGYLDAIDYAWYILEKSMVLNTGVTAE
jgi:hypothetical protein